MRPRLLVRPVLLLAAAGALTLSACGSGVSESDDGAATTLGVPDLTLPEATTSTTEAAAADATTTTEAGADTTATTAGAGAGDDVPEPTSPDGLGDDPELDALAQDCFDGDFSACDQLFFESPADSDYEAYGDSCGGRNEPGGLCVNIYGDG